MHEHEGEEGDGHHRELLEQHRPGQARNRPAVTLTAREGKGQQYQRERGGIVLPEPRRSDGDRIGHHEGSEHQPPRQWRSEGHGRGEAAEGEQQHEEAKVVEGGGQQPPRRRGDHRAREVRVVLERHLSLAHPLGNAAVERVEALEARALVVVSVGVGAVEREVPGDLDLIRRVVRVKPGRGGLAQPHLEEGRG